MYAPHTVTIYNVVHDVDTSTMEDTTELHCTVLKGVFFDASKGANVRQSGLEGADAVNLYIPFSVEATDGTTGKDKVYCEPQAFRQLADKSGAWTLSVKGDGTETFFVKGEYITENEKQARLHDDSYNVTKIDAKDFGSIDMRHWQVGGA